MNLLIRKINSPFLLVIIFCFVQFLWAEEICEFYFEGCPEDYHEDTIVVPEYVVSLSQNVYVCEPSEVIENVIDTGGGPASILFIIDHSYSMLGAGVVHPGRDTYGARFAVIRDLIDTIYNTHKTSEIGLVVFNEQLYFDHRNNSNFVQLQGYGDQSYLPLKKLDSLYSGKTGRDICIETLETDTVKKFNMNLLDSVECVDLVYKPGFATIGNTNINVAFEAAKASMKSAIYEKDRQFIIFLSDGEPYPIDNNGMQNGIPAYEFVKADSVPTTFTVFFTNNPNPPDSLIKMTENIKNNGYSQTNPQSNIWAKVANYDTLKALLMNNVIQTVVVELKSKPTKININGQTSNSYNNQWFLFNQKFNLEKDKDISYFEFDIDYTVTSSLNGQTFDTSTHSAFWVKRDPNVDTLEEEFGEWCWVRSMAFYYNDSLVTFANETMDQLEIRFTYDPGDADYHYTKVDVEITNFMGQSLDSEDFNLSKTGSYFTKTFARNLNSINQGDGTLQHQAADSIIAIFRNPEIPLDTLRVAIPFKVSQSVEAVSGIYYDRNADGYVDSIDVVFNGFFSPSDLNELVDVITLPPHRGFKINTSSMATNGIALTVDEDNSYLPVTSVTSLDILTIKQTTLPNGGLVIAKTAPIIDKVAPVIESAHLLDYANDSITDTLCVILSENVMPITKHIPFYFRNPRNGIQYYAYLNRTYSSKDTAIFWVQYKNGINNEPIIAMENGDSIWINSDSINSVIDEVYNIQDNPLNVRRLLNVKIVHIPYDIIITGNTILDPLNPVIVPDFILQLNGLDQNITTGLIIIVKPDNPENMSGDSLSATLSIFDPIGNTIILKEKMGYYNGGGDPNKIGLFFVWNGRNRNERKVGPGMYLAVAYINRIDKFGNIYDKELKKHFIGVKGIEANPF